MAKSFGDLVEAEIAKGCSPTVARQKVAYAFPQAARESRESIAKHESGVSGIYGRVDEIKKVRGCSRVEAMSAARRENPDLYWRFENV